MIKKIIIYLVIILSISGIIYYFSSNKKEESIYTTEKVVTGKIIQTVSETGTVISQDSLDLSFGASAKLKEKNTSTGKSVLAGDVLAKLDISSLEIQKEDALNSLELAKIEYNKLLRGAKNEDIAISQAGINQAQASYDSALKDLEKIKEISSENKAQAEKNVFDLESKKDTDKTSLEQAVIVAQNNLENAKSIYGKNINNQKNTSVLLFDDKIALANIALDKINKIINEKDYDSYLSVKNIAYKNNTKNKYEIAVNQLKNIKEKRKNISEQSGNDDIFNTLNDLLTLLDNTFLALDFCYKALESSVSSNSFTDSQIDAFKTSISGQQAIISNALTASENTKQALNTAIINYETNINSAQASLKQAEVNLNDALANAKNSLASVKKSNEQQLTSAQAKVDNAYKSLQLAKTQFDKTIAQVDKYDLSLASLKIKQAENNLKAIENKIKDSIIIAPIAGTIVKDNFKVGEQVNQSAVVFELLGDAGFELEVLISESDITKVSIEDQTEITLDAFGDDVKFTGKVIFIEPAETKIQDVIYFKVKIAFDAKDFVVKSGMTANIIITTEIKENIVLVPIRAVVEKSSEGKFVKILNGEQLIEKKVEIGLYGDDGMAEVLSGLSTGEDVVVSVKK